MEQWQTCCILSASALSLASFSFWIFSLAAVRYLGTCPYSGLHTYLGSSPSTPLGLARMVSSALTTMKFSSTCWISGGGAMSRGSFRLDLMQGATLGTAGTEDVGFTG